MFSILDSLQPTALPALFFLVWLPLFLWLRAAYTRVLFIVAGGATLVFVAGPPLALGLSLIIVGGYGLVEGAARLRHQFVAGLAVIVALHIGYWACFHLFLPGGYAALGGDSGPGVYVLYSGIGLTFFRLLSYFWDRVRTQMPALSPTDYLAYMLFFPQFRHGPIERPMRSPLNSAARTQDWTPADVAHGLLRVGFGLVAIFGLLHGMRVMLPGEYRHAPWGWLTARFADPQNLSLPQLLVLLHLPALALYLFESGAAHIELGVSRIFGVRGSENFAYPLLAADPGTIWHRWNVTLSRWVRDYAYIPLGGNRRRKYLNLILAFLYCGALHGLRPNCLAWGAWAGGTLALYRWLADRRNRRTSPARQPGHWLLRPLALTLARLGTIHWFCIGATIFLDAQYCGYRVLRQYICLLAGLFV